MALMLVLPEVFERTWGIRRLICVLAEGNRVRAAHHIRNFQFMAEVYWYLEWTMLHQGFDYAYDKRLYDRLREGHARPVREASSRPGSTTRTSWRVFLENHDEPRAATTFPPGIHQAAAVITLPVSRAAFLPSRGNSGAKETDIPPSGSRSGQNPSIQTIENSSTSGCSACCADPLPVKASGACSIVCLLGKVTGHGIVSWPSRGKVEGRRATAGRGELCSQSGPVFTSGIPFTDLGGGAWRLQNQMEDVGYDRDGSDLQSRGLYLDMPPWQASVFALTRTS